MNIVGSFYKPNEEVFELPCVIYLHGNASDQTEGTFLVPIFIPAAVSVLCFDFSGCGKSEGQYISLGYYEKDDVSCAIDFVRSNFGVGRVALWGRSMGAITSIYSLADDPTVAAAVLDSPMASLPDLVKEIAAKENIPGLIASTAQWLIGKKIKEVAGFDIAKVVPIELAPMCFSPVLFIHGEQDDFIAKSHTERLFKEYSGEDKQVMYVEGEHNSRRPFDTMIAAVIFIARNLDAPVVIDDAARAIAGGPSAQHFSDVGAMMYAMD
jgi:pimeloyl-ACP methyl ester carboxylesterase